jgi:hypothetical protein
MLAVFRKSLIDQATKYYSDANKGNRLLNRPEKPLQVERWVNCRSLVPVDRQQGRGATSFSNRGGAEREGFRNAMHGESQRRDEESGDINKFSVTAKSVANSSGARGEFGLFVRMERAKICCFKGQRWCSPLRYLCFGEGGQDHMWRVAKG